MAIYTRDLANKQAREALKHGSYTVVIWLDENFKVKQTKVFNRLSDRVLQKSLSENEKYKLIRIHNDEIQAKFGTLDTIRDLENILYVLFNKKIKELHKETISAGIYYRDVGGHSKSIAKFYALVSDNKDGVLVKPIGKKLVDGKYKAPLFIPNPKEVTGNILKATYDGDKLRLLDREFTHRQHDELRLAAWDGEPFLEIYS